MTTAQHLSLPAPGPGALPDAPRTGDRARRIRRRLERLIGTPATEYNSLLPLRNGDQIFSAMLSGIRAARRTVDLMTFVYWKGAIACEFAEALADRARAGVRVRLLLDGFGSRLIERRLLAMMAEAGVQVAWFRRPLWLSPFKQNHRCHRKVLVVDETTAFTGGVGIAEEWAGDARHETEWRETHFRVRGPAVDGIAAAFTQNWAECHGGLFDDRDGFAEHRPEGDAVVQVVRGSASVGWQDMKTLLRVVLESAESRIRLTTAYFAPDADFAALLGAAARRGVEVELLVPGRHTDKPVCRLAGRRLYAGLLEAGVRIWEYRPTMMHAKVLTVDGVLSLVGSGNFNRRSLDHDEEIMLAVLDEELAATLDAHFDQDLTASESIDARTWAARPLLWRLREGAVVPIRRFL
ncbi:phospholipase D-like domain-containing protein [Streptomyces sp. NPDC002734]|uniref:phospholipase D-like domain-containing protein n=1 Tax=Streptomyces sp. NPDC002734 TaxID=3154426 RepID=UPI00331E3583